MRFAVEQWSPEFGAPTEDLDLSDAPTASVDPSVEHAPEDWAPISAGDASPATSALFIDGVRRVDARVWMGEALDSRLGICASCAAGVVRCDGKARVEKVLVQRILIGPQLEGQIATRHATYEPFAVVDDRVESLMNGLALALSGLEAAVATEAASADLIVLDGPLRGRERIPGAIGYIKSHRAPYLAPDQTSVIPRLRAGERTPVFLIETSWIRYSWYLKLPHGGEHSWSGIVRCEAPSTLSRYESVELANLTCATLPQYASEPHKDGRAPHNLYPIKGLEDLLRARLGSAEFLYRSLLGVSKDLA